jgi:integrase
MIDRELTGPSDWKLMCFERMRILDMAHYWAVGTHAQYQSKLNAISQFELAFGIEQRILRPTPLLRPPASSDIGLMWMMESYSLRTTTLRGTDERQLLSNATVRQLRSATSQYCAWDLMVSKPDGVYFDQQRRLICQPCRPTDGLGCSLFASGIASRIGEDVSPSVALLDRHVRSLLSDLEELYLSAQATAARRHAALAGLATLLLWLGWLRSSETFDLRWQDFDVVEPENGPLVDLPRGCGVVGVRLGPETKSSRNKAVDMFIAYQCFSGYHIGKWFHRARRCCGIGADYKECSSRVFTHPAGTPWTSHFYRHSFLYPSLTRQRLAGDVMLAVFDDTPGNTVASKFWSLHCFRRGARSQVSRGGKFGHHRFRKALKSQVYEHGRWRRRRSSEEIDIVYTQWTVHQCIQITLYCM